MKTIASFLMLLSLSTAVLAQVEGITQCDCEQYVPLSDITCSSPFDCTTPSDHCQSVTFTATCTGRYTLTVSISCSSGSCSNYNVCAMLYDSGGSPLGHCYDLGQCSPCANSCTTDCLYSGRQYTLYVCLQSCGEDDCPSPVTCMAYGIAKYCGPSNDNCL